MLTLPTSKAPRTSRGIETLSRFSQYCLTIRSCRLSVLPEGLNVVRARLPPGRSRHVSSVSWAHAFQATNTEARPTHQHQSFAVRLPISESSYWQALFYSGLSCLSYSPPAFVQQVAAVVRLRVFLSPEARSARQRALHDGIATLPR